MTKFEKIKSQITSMSAEEYMLVMEDSAFVFHCAFCESYQYGDGRCDGECKTHCLNWLNSEAEE